MRSRKTVSVESLARFEENLRMMSEKISLWRDQISTTVVTRGKRRPRKAAEGPRIEKKKSSTSDSYPGDSNTDRWPGSAVSWIVPSAADIIAAGPSRRSEPTSHSAADVAGPPPARSDQSGARCIKRFLDRESL
jgi:hypothetical protein